MKYGFVGIVKKMFRYSNVFFYNPLCRVSLIRNKNMKSGRKPDAARPYHRRREKMRRPYRFAALGFALVLLCSGFSFAQQEKTVGGRIIVCMVQVEHADVDYLASALEPFLSSEGRIVPYKPTNTLIIKDREPVVNMLAEAIKGKSCTPSADPSENETGPPQQEFYLDR
jgi:type II secretory pathway component GspD/PulD (secretin)